MSAYFHLMAILALFLLCVPSGQAQEVLPEASISDVVIAEGATAAFLVSLSQTSTLSVTIAYTTSDGTAVAGEDYTSASGTLTMLPGQTEGTISVETIADTADEEDETFTLTLSDPQNAVLLSEQATATIGGGEARSLVYTLFVRGNQYGNSPRSMRGNGYLVLYPDLRKATSLLQWADGSIERLDWHTEGMWYIADLGRVHYWFLTSGVNGATNHRRHFASFRYSHLHGIEHPNPVDIGGSEAYASANLNGKWRSGEAQGPGKGVRMATMHARLDLETTRELNGEGLLYEGVIDELTVRLEELQPAAQEVEADLAAESAAVVPVADAAVPAAEEGLVCYRLSEVGIRAGDGGLERVNHVGYLVVDLVSGKMMAIIAGRDQAGYWYRIEDWTDNDLLQFDASAGGRQFRFQGGRKGLPNADAGFKFQLLHGAAQSHQIGRGNKKTVAPSFSGENWQHEMTDEATAAGVYTNSTVACQVLGALTLHMNQELMTLEEAVQYLVENHIPDYFEQRTE